MLKCPIAVKLSSKLASEKWGLAPQSHTGALRCNCCMLHRPSMQFGSCSSYYSSFPAGQFGCLSLTSLLRNAWWTYVRDILAVQRVSRSHPLEWTHLNYLFNVAGFIVVHPEPCIVPFRSALPSMFHFCHTHSLLQSACGCWLREIRHSELSDEKVEKS